MITQYTQRTMDMTVSETPIVLFKDIWQGIIQFGCGLGGIPYENE
jgi:hypothetical protein